MAIFFDKSATIGNFTPLMPPFFFSVFNPNYSSAEELGIIIYGGIFYLLVLIKFAPNTDGLIQNI